MQLVARAVDDRAVGVDRQLVAVGDDAELGRRLDEHLADVGRRVRRLARGVVAGEQQQVGDEPAHAPRRAQRGVRRLPRSPSRLSASSSRFASTLVSGVRSSCEASATNSRWRCSALLGLRARRVERVEHAVERARELGDLVVGLVVGMRRAGSRVRSILRAVAVSAAIGAIARVATTGPASSARPAPLSTPMMRNRRTRLTVASTSASGRAYWT